MEQNKFNNEFIEKYFWNLLSKEEIEEFKKELKANEKFRDEVKFYKHIFAAFRELEYEEAEKKIDGFLQNIKEDEDEQLAQKYVLKEVSENQRKEIENRIKNDPDFRKKVHFYKQLQVASIDYSYIEAEEKVPKLIEKAEKNKKIKTLYNITGIAASIIILIGTVFIINNKKHNIDNILSYKPEKQILTLLVQSTWGSEKNGPIAGINSNPVLDYFENQKYDEIIEYSNSHTESFKNNKFNIFALGISYFNTQDYSNAIKYLQKALEIQSNTDDKFSNTLDNTSLWYLAISYYNNKDMESAKKYLKLIISKKDNDKEIIKKAREMLRMM